MIIFKINVKRTFAGPAERYAVVPRNTNGPPLRVAPKTVEPVSC